MICEIIGERKKRKREGGIEFRNESIEDERRTNAL